MYNQLFWRNIWVVA